MDGPFYVTCNTLLNQLARSHLHLFDCSSQVSSSRLHSTLVRLFKSGQLSSSSFNTCLTVQVRPANSSSLNTVLF